MRLLKLACSLVLALAILGGLGVLLTAHSVQAAPLSGVVPVTTTIQVAIDGAQDGDTISIPAGTYTESLTVNKNLTLTGVTSATTIIRAVTNQRVITVTSGYSLQLRNLAIVGGRAGSDSGGGVLVNNGQLQLNGVLVADNWATYGGGIFQAGSGGVEVIDSRIERNRSNNHGGGLYVTADAALSNTWVLSNTAVWDGGGLLVWNGRANIVGGKFAGNQAQGRNGGGIDLNNSLTISGTSFVSNTAQQDGGGVLQWNSDQFVTVINARFEDNYTGRNGGGLNIAQGATTTVTNSLFLSNTANFATNTDSSGAGLFFDGAGALQISTSTFRANRTNCIGCSYTSGGGAYINAPGALVQDSLFEKNWGWDGGGLGSFKSITIRRSVFQENSGGYGGGAYVTTKTDIQDSSFLRNSPLNHGGGLQASGEVHIAGTRFISNTAGYDTGGLHLIFATAYLTNNVFLDNRTQLGGGGVYVEGSELHAQHTTLARNQNVSGSHYGLCVVDYLTTVHSQAWLTNTLLVSHTVGVTVTGGSTVTLDSTLWFGNQTDQAGVVFATRNYTGNPVLAADGYHLTAASQSAIDKGVNSGVTSDIDGNSRPLGNGFDLGADESPYGVTLMASNNSPLSLGSPTNFTATLTGIMSPAPTFSWAFGDGLSGTGAKPLHTYGTAGFYTATVTVANGLLTLTAITPITITAPPLRYTYLPLILRP